MSHVIEDSPFVDGLIEWMQSDQGQLSDQARELTWQFLDTADVIDTANRRMVWHNVRKFSIEQVAQHIHAQAPELSVELIESHITGWLEMEYCPEDCTDAQMQELELQIQAWLDEYHQSKLSTSV